MNLSTHFTLQEFTRSNKADALGLSNEATPEIVEALLGVAAMLENVREHLSAVVGKPIPITITSGYRSPELNKAVGGVTSSDHVRGMAADILAPDFGTPHAIACELASHLDGLSVGQMIVEQTSPTRVWLHLSTAMPVKPVNRILSFDGHAYEVGIQGVA